MPEASTTPASTDRKSRTGPGSRSAAGPEKIVVPEGPDLENDLLEPADLEQSDYYGQSRSRSSGQSRQTGRSAPRPESKEANDGPEPDPVLQQLWSLGRGYSQETFQRHASFIGDATFSSPKDAQKRVIAMRELQRTYGNQYVQRLAGNISSQRSGLVQANLTVSQPGDPYEREADRVAGQVVRVMSIAGQEPVQRTNQGQRLATEAAIQRCRDGQICGPCSRGECPHHSRGAQMEREILRLHRVHRQAVAEASHPGTEVEQSIQWARGSGQTLPEDVRQSMEGAFGVDFSGVRVHTGAEADGLNRSVSARAFTTGQDIFFRQGEYSPASLAGKELLAHELTHVVQQAGGRVQIQLARSDLQVRGVFEPLAGEMENFVFFDLGDTSLEATQRERAENFAATLAGDPSQPVTLVGFASEEGDPGFNTQVVNDRIESVARVLIEQGHDPSAITRVPRPEASKGRIDYRRWRAVEILVGGQRSSHPDCSTMAQTVPFTLVQQVLFTMSKGLATHMITQTAGHLRVPTPTVTRIAEQLFGPAPPVDDLADDLDRIRGSLAALVPDSDVLLGTPCNETCQGGTKAFVNRNSGKMTLCPGFFDADIAQQARILVHECAHIPTGLDVRDRAYGWERLINILGQVAPAHARDNADSYALLVLLDNGVTGLPGTQAPTDDLSALPPGDQAKAEQALAYLQRWNTATRIYLNWLYNQINEGIESGSWTDPYILQQTQFVGAQFGFNVRSSGPRDEDRAAIAAIYDRFVIMGRALKSPITFTTSSGNTRWEEGPGDEVAVAPSLWRRNTTAQVRLLLRRLAYAMPSHISRPLVPAYVRVSDRFRQNMGEGP